MHARRRDHDGADDAALGRLLEQAGDPGLGEAELRGDLGLSNPCSWYSRATFVSSRSRSRSGVRMREHARIMSSPFRSSLRTPLWVGPGPMDAIHAPLRVLGEDAELVGVLGVMSSQSIDCFSSAGLVPSSTICTACSTAISAPSAAGCSAVAPCPPP